VNKPRRLGKATGFDNFHKIIEMAVLHPPTFYWPSRSTTKHFKRPKVVK
jgi:hypothetical protein